MDLSNVKGLLQSRTVWANIVGFLALILGVLGYDEAKAVFADPAFVDQILALVTAAAFILSTVFRVFAKTKVVAAPVVKKAE
jgi:hypothetical protein